MARTADTSLNGRHPLPSAANHSIIKLRLGALDPVTRGQSNQLLVTGRLNGSNVVELQRINS
jgi:hypothetical protein